MAFAEDFARLREQLRNRMAHVTGEESTKQALILPFLSLLGWDVWNPQEVQPEYVADFAKKRTSGQMEKVDYALIRDGSLVMLMEAKSADATLENHDPQLARYFNSTPSVRVGIITNGIDYRFFSDLRAPNVIDERPFFSFNVLSANEQQIEMLRPFTRTFFDPVAIVQHAEEMTYVAALNKVISEQLRNPSDSFLRFLLGEAEVNAGKSVTAKVLDRFRPVVKKAIHGSLLELMSRGLTQATETPAPAATPLPPVVQPLASTPAAPLSPALQALTACDADADSTPEEKLKRGINTTDEELRAFGTMRTQLGDPADLYYQDSVNYFSIFRSVRTRWVARLCFDARRKHIVTRVSTEEAAMLLPGFEIEAAPNGLGVSRVYFSGDPDLLSVMPLLRVAFDRATGGA